MKKFESGAMSLLSDIHAQDTLLQAVFFFKKFVLMSVYHFIPATLVAGVPPPPADAIWRITKPRPNLTSFILSLPSESLVRTHIFFVTLDIIIDYVLQPHSFDTIFGYYYYGFQGHC